MSGTKPQRDLNSLVCPWWLSATLSTGFRRPFHDPTAILGPFVRPGMTVADIGCGPGYFTVPLAGLVGGGGRVIAIDLQEKMLMRARSSAERAGLADRIVFHHAGAESIGVTARVDFALAFWMVHEVPDQERFFTQIAGFLAPGGRLLVVEPRLHVGRRKYDSLLAAAARAGFRVTAAVAVSLSRGALLGRD